MQLVSRETLESLLKSNKIKEDDKTTIKSFSYDDFLREYYNKYNTWTNKLKHVDIQTIPYNDKNYWKLCNVYDEVKLGYLKHNCPPIKFIAEGSSRGAYAIEGGKCLKVAMSDKGIAQNKHEIKISNNPKFKYSCFTQMFDFDKKFKGSLLTECCSKARKQDFKNLYNLDFEWICEILDDSVDFKFNIQMYTEVINTSINNIEKLIKINNNPHQLQQNKRDLNTNKIKKIFLEQLQYSQEPQWEILRDLFLFYQENGEAELSIGDLFGIENWGLAIRNGILGPVIIDAGLSNEVYDKYYCA